MSRALINALRELQEGWVYRNASRMRTLLEGHGTPGTRAAPAKAGNNDQKYGVRIDNGELIVKEDGKTYKQYKVQVNKDADNSTLKKMAQKDSHRVWATAEIEIEADDGGKGKDEKSEGGKNGKGEGDDEIRRMKEKLDAVFTKMTEDVEGTEVE